MTAKDEMLPCSNASTEPHKPLTLETLQNAKKQIEALLKAKAEIPNFIEINGVRYMKVPVFAKELTVELETRNDEKPRTFF